MIFDVWPTGMMDQEVTLQGTARNAHAGALVVLSDRKTIYVGGLQEWPDELDRKQVRVTGVVRRTKLAPDPEVNAEGEVSHGMVGSVTIVDEAVWEEAT